MKKARKKYRIREGSPLDIMIGALPIAAIIGMFVICGILTSWDLGLL